jgi:hypothetical protein
VYRIFDSICHELHNKETLKNILQYTKFMISTLSDQPSSSDLQSTSAAASTSTATTTGAQRVMHSSASIQTMQENIKKMRKEYDSLTSEDQNGRKGTALKNLIKLTLENIESPVIVSKGEERRQKTIEKYSKQPGFSFLTKKNYTNGNGLAPSSGTHRDVHVPSTSLGAQLNIVGNSEPETGEITDIENPQPDLEIVIRLIECKDFFHSYHYYTISISHPLATVDVIQLNVNALKS